jgi:hypothetical protein
MLKERSFRVIGIVAVPHMSLAMPLVDKETMVIRLNGQGMTRTLYAARVEMAE